MSLGISNSCVAPQAKALKISNYTNAHAENPALANYGGSVCLSTVSSPLTASCTYRAGACLVGEECLVTLFSATDSHIGDCITSPYPNSMCCSVS